MNIDDIFIDLSKVGPDKLEELVLHVSKMSENDKRFLSTKLNKVVWAADFAAFCSTGRTISGATYQKGPHGPIPKAMPIVLEKLRAKGRLKIESVMAGDKPANRPIALEGANLSAFSTQELATVDKVIAENFDKSGSRMSNDTHKYLAWIVAEMGETIPFTAWLVNAPKASDSHAEVGAEIEAELRDAGAA